jgi:hypothetical protein
MLGSFSGQEPAAGVTDFGTASGDSGHWLSHLAYPAILVIF